MPSVEELLATAQVVSVPLGVRFRGVVHREALLLRGPAGWGEFSPFLEYDDVQASRWLATAVEAAFTGWPPPVRHSVPVNATVPAVASREVASVLARFDGCTTAKVKVAEAGQSLAEDVARVREVRALLGPSGRIRVDANGGWTVHQAVAALAELGPYDLEYAEQPCASVEELALVRARTDVLIAADESVRKAADPLHVVRAGAADVLVLKVSPLGGVLPALAIARECGLPIVVSSALDTAVGIRAAVALAAALPDLPYACGLATGSLLSSDVADYRAVAGALTVRTVAPDPNALNRLAATDERTQWWRARLVRCAAILSG